MKKRFRQYLISISILVLVGYPRTAAWSCVWDLGLDGTMFRLFQSSLHGKPDLESFYYTEHFMGYSQDTTDEDNHINCKEWQRFTKGKATEQDIYKIQYDVSASDFIFAYNTNSWGKLEDNTFIKWLRKNRNAMDYFVFAKQVEGTQYEFTPNWDVPVKARRTYDSLVNIGLDKCASRLPEFLIERYAFQSVKMMFYKEYYSHRDTDISANPIADNKPLIKCYETYLKGSKSIVADWGMLFYSFAFADRTKRALYLIKTFDRCESKKKVVYNHLLASTAADIPTAGLSDKTVAAIKAFQAIKTEGRALPLIKDVYYADPESHYMKLLVCREINKIEDWVLSPEVLGFTSGMERSEYEQQNQNSDTTYAYYALHNLEKDKAYAGELRRLLMEVVNSNVSYKNFLKLAIVHLYHIEGNYLSAGGELATIPHFNNPKMEMQRLIEQTMSLIGTQDITSPLVQLALEKQFAQLEKAGLVDRNNVKHEWYENEPSRYMLNELYMVLSKQYMAKGDMVRAALCYKKANLQVNEYTGKSMKFISVDDSDGYYENIDFFDKYATPRDVDKLLDFLSKKDYSKFEKRIMPPVALNKNALLDLKGTLLVRQGKFEEALDVFKQMPNDFWQNTYYFKYYLRKSNITSVGTLLPVKTGNNKNYSIPSKKAIMADIVQLRQQLKTATNAADKARICFMLGNSYFNISYYGKDWMVYSYGQSMSEQSLYPGGEYYGSFSFYPDIAKHNNAYYLCGWARDMYMQALVYTGKNKELTAQCLLMLTLCDKNAVTSIREQKPYLTGINTNGDKPPYLSPFMKKAYKEFAKTTVFERAASECPDVREYVDKL